ncbi:uracil-DNA glycosylase [Halapricum hydrolyticum]|uniref:Uracil-DNA glycosylase n=1 Tax=Halapricum hydrolyticum TaxID=2979991 RepID=A0AAE3LIX3_9EURY|nr:uracil-DNA glycosylase [Halapricum hydrolyticum]MCU4719390.1 uracil-DNA glycosylase [Halapricum hydrolyticum]MCU4728399.1 uracil-DNA glycosylase [Halapricum hydrolyticum]
MDANQESPYNPFGMDEACQNCPELAESRTQVVHGYGDVSAEFAFVGGFPDAGADEVGIPFMGAGRETMLEILRETGFTDSPPETTEPEIDNAVLTYAARCHHPDRKPTDGEFSACEPYLTSELRMINPEIIVAVGQHALEALAWEYTTRSADEFDVEAEHASTVRGRGFEIVPMIEPAEQTDAQTDALIEHLLGVLGRDYRQTKGRRGR